MPHVPRPLPRAIPLPRTRPPLAVPLPAAPPAREGAAMRDAGAGVVNLDAGLAVVGGFSTNDVSVVLPMDQYVAIMKQAFASSQECGLSINLPSVPV